MQLQQVEQVIKGLAEQLGQSKPMSHSKKVVLPNNELSLGELAEVLGVLAKEYNTTLPNLLVKLDKVSGDLNDLDKVFKGDTNAEWTQDEDDLLSKNEGLLRRWKGEEAVERRKKYLNL